MTINNSQGQTFQVCIRMRQYFQSSGSILALGAGGLKFATSMIPVRLTNPSLARWWRLLNEMYIVKWCPAWLPCSYILLL